MAELVLDRIRKLQLVLFAVVIVLLFFGGCGKQESGGGAEPEDRTVSLSGGVDINAMGTDEWRGIPDSGGAEDRGETEGSGDTRDTAGAEDPHGSGNAAEPKRELNPNASTVTYQGAAFMSSCRTIGGDSIYNTGYLGEFDGNSPAGGDYSAGRIGMEEDAIQQFSLEIPEDMFAYRGCVDDQGRWHLLLSQRTDGTVTYRKTEIWVIDREGELEQSFDITECAGEGVIIPGWMEVDREGNYYFASGGKILVIKVADQSAQSLLFSGEIIGFGRGRSGALYGVFTVEGNDFLGIVDPGSGSIEKCVDFPENNVRPKFSVLQGGAKTELLLANMGEGIWSYDGTELRQETTLKNIVTNGQDILGMGFLWDGRACIMSYEGGQYVFHYVPVEM